MYKRQTYDATNRIVSAAYGEGVDTTSFNYQYDAAGNIVKFSISCPSPCPQCSSHPVNLTNTTFPSGTLCECADETSITIGAGVTIEKGASVIFKAPKVYVKSGAKIVEGANVLIRQN